MASSKSTCGLFLVVVVVLASASLSLAYSNKLDTRELDLCLKQCESPECKARCVDVYYKGEVLRVNDVDNETRLDQCRRNCYDAGGTLWDILRCYNECSKVYNAHNYGQ